MDSSQNRTKIESYQDRNHTQSSQSRTKGDSSQSRDTSNNRESSNYQGNNKGYKKYDMDGNNQMRRNNIEDKYGETRKIFTNQNFK